MEITTEKLSVKTRGNTDMIDLTPHLKDLLSETKFLEGQMTVFVPGSTAGITNIEFEPGLLKDLPEFFDRILPANEIYHHDETWHDGNGYAHLRSALIKPSFTIPFTKGALLLGTWQQIILLDFDNRPRHRELVIQIIGKKKAG
jgi:secondary thiamine-phosphate synthase enzyme